MSESARERVTELLLEAYKHRARRPHLSPRDSLVASISRVCRLPLDKDPEVLRLLSELADAVYADSRVRLVVKQKLGPSVYETTDPDVVRQIASVRAELEIADWMREQC